MRTIRYLMMALLCAMTLPVMSQYGPATLPNQQPGGVDNNHNQADQPMRVPDYIKPGFQMTYMGFGYVDDGDPKQAATTGMGYTVFTVVAVLKDKVLLSATNYLTPNGLPLNPDKSFDYDTDANAQLSNSNNYTVSKRDALMGDAIWMPVDHLKQWESGDKLKIVEGSFPYRGKSVSTIALLTEHDDGAISNVFNVKNGQKLISVSAFKGGKQQSQTQLLGTKQIDSPLIGAKWPDWAKSVKTMSYSGTYTMAPAGIDPLTSQMSTEIKFTERGDGYAIGKSTMKRDGAAAGTSVVMQGPGSAFGYWIHPDVLANLDGGTVEENKITRTKTTYQVQQGNLGKLGVFVHTNTKNTFYAVNGYNLQTGALVYINMHAADTGITVEFKLDGIESE